MHLKRAVQNWEDLGFKRRAKGSPALIDSKWRVTETSCIMKLHPLVILQKSPLHSPGISLAKYLPINTFFIYGWMVILMKGINGVISHSLGLQRICKLPKHYNCILSNMFKLWHIASYKVKNKKQIKKPLLHWIYSPLIPKIFSQKILIHCLTMVVRFVTWPPKSISRTNYYNMLHLQ